MDYEEETPPRRSVALPVLLGLAGLSAVSLIFIIAFAIKSDDKPAPAKTGLTQQEVTREEHLAWEQEPLPPREEPMFLPGPMDQREWSIQEEDQSPIVEGVRRLGL